MPNRAKQDPADRAATAAYVAELSSDLAAWPAATASTHWATSSTWRGSRRKPLASERAEGHDPT